MKTKRWLKCLLMVIALMMAVNVGTAGLTASAATSSKKAAVEKGTKFRSGKLQYKVTSVNTKKKTGTVALIDADSGVKTANIPKTVKKSGYTLTVNEIGANAFKDCRKLTKVVTNTEIKKIGKNAFSGCKKLEEIDIQSRKLTSVDKSAMKGVPGDVVVSVPEGKAASYEKKLNVTVQEPETEAPAAQQPQAAPETAVPGAEDSADTALPSSAAEVKAPAAEASVAEVPAQTEMRVPETEAPKAASAPAQTEAPKAATAPAAKAPAQTEAPTAATAPAAAAPAQTEAPKAATPAQTEAPKAATAPAAKAPAQTEAPKAAAKAQVQTEAPKAAAPAAKAPAQTEAPKAAAKAPAQTEAPKAAAKAPAQTEAPKAAAPAAKAPAQTEAPKAAAKAPAQTEAPKVAAKAPAQTEAPKAAAKTPETNAPQTEIVIQATEAPQAPETEAPHVCEFIWVVTKEPYCGYLGYDMTWRDTGSKTGTCPICGKTVTKGIRLEEHQFEVLKDVEPTCTENGATYYKCALCGYQTVDSHDADGNIRSALGHEMVHHDDPAACTQDGRSYDQCSRCGQIQNETVTAPKTGHDFASGQILSEKAATCVQDGLREIACAHAGCTEIKSERIPAVGHDFIETKIEATCYRNEKIETTCTKCDYKSIKTVSGTMKQHNMTEEKIETYATTEVEGHAVRECTNEGCGYVETVVIPRVKCDHEWVHVTGQPGDQEGALASMSDTGKIRTERCTKCSELRYAYNIGESWVPWSEVPCNGKGHTWGEPKENGHVYCSVCGTTRPEGGQADPETGRETNARARIVWDATFKADSNVCGGFRLSDGSTSYSAVLTSISSDNRIEVEAPEPNAGYVFEKWTWSHSEEEIPDDLYEKLEDGSIDRTELSVPCDYMNVVFTAHYITEAEQAALQMQEQTEIPQVIHGEHQFDLSEHLADAPAAANEDPAQQETAAAGQPAAEPGQPAAEAEDAAEIIEEAGE